ncbi:MAG: hypothetical protein HY682_00905 [Chloroflexi bacterium]|nr:hypothetical protein [Chloroflexota bacterium]
MVLLAVLILVIAVLILYFLGRAVVRSRSGADARASWAAAGVLGAVLLPLIYLFVSKRGRNRSG